MSYFFKTFFIIIVTMFCLSCVTTQSGIQAGSVGFTEELDEPSARGQLKRISPEQSNVMFRFCLSPDEKHIIYSGLQSGGGDNLLQLWKISSGGSCSPIKITSGGSSHYKSPSFTSDGNYIVYESEGMLWKVRKDGAGGKMRIPGSGMGRDMAPHVSANDVVVFCSIQQTSLQLPAKYLIWTSNLDGGELTQIREGRYPRWAPYGKKIAFDHDGEIWVINSDGTNLMQLTNSSEVSEILPSFSVDGNNIVFASNEGKDGKPMVDWNIWSMKSDGSQKVQITELNAWDSWPIWGIDGIYFLSARAQKEGENSTRIWKLKK